MKKIILASAALISAFALSACGDDSSTSAESSSCAEGLSSGCLKGTWNLTDIIGTSGNAGKGTLTFTKSEFTYSPSAADMLHTYCPTNELTGKYEIQAPSTIIFKIEGLKMKDCFPQAPNGDGLYNVTTHITTLKVQATATETSLNLTGTTTSPFVPNDEAGKTEVYTRMP